jgi:CBS domain-containing protein
MSPGTLSDLTRGRPPLLDEHEPVGAAVRRLVDSGLPALPVVGHDRRLLGIFGEREFIAALFPGYLDELHSARFVPRAIDEALERRSGCAREPVIRYANTEHIDVGSDASDAQVAETFLHHRVLIVPVTDAGQVVGVITRSDFFRALVERFKVAVADNDPADT